MCSDYQDVNTSDCELPDNKKLFDMDVSNSTFKTWLLLQKHLDAEIVSAFVNFEEAAEQFSSDGETEGLKSITRMVEKLLEQGKIDILPYHLKLIASDCFVILQNYSAAVITLPRPELTQRSSMLANRILTLRHLANLTFDARELIMLKGPNVTKFGRDYLHKIYEYIDTVIPQGEERSLLLSSWARDCKKSPYFLFNATMFVYYASKRTPIQEYDFVNNPITIDYINKITKIAENVIREEMGIPKIGEGWVSETKLFYEIKKAFEGYTVLQHASPLWLGRQHLDVFLPEINVALEFQGEQHDRAVGFFGGEESFLRNMKRDIRKLRICNKNGVRIIYVRPGYELSQIISEITEKNIT